MKSWNTLDRYIDKREEHLNKAFELMGLISAGMFAAIVSIKGEAPNTLVGITMISSVITVWGVITRFLLGAKLWGKTASAYISDPNEPIFIVIKGAGFLFSTSIISFVVASVAFLAFLMGV